MQVTKQLAASAAPSALTAVQPVNNPTPGQFASLLRQSQAPTAGVSPRHGAAPTPATPPPAQPDSSAADNEADAASPPDAPAASQAAVKARPKSPDKAPAAKPAERSAKPASADDPTTEARDPQENVGGKRSGDVRADPPLDPWLAALQRPLGAAGTTAQYGSDAGDALASDTAPGARTSGALDAKDDPRSDAKARAEAHETEYESAARALGAGDELASLRAGKPAFDESQSLRGLHLPSAPGVAAFSPAVGSTREPAAPLVVTLPTPLASPEFAQALGVQMSVLASGGVQRAELQLNPAEMGPVSVQIVIDGTTAQVDFGADMAATRQAIEAGLPELAGALRDAGFTLTGGGVSQHSRGRGETRDDTHGSGPGSGRGADTTHVETSARALRRTVSAGGVDLYA